MLPHSIGRPRAIYFRLSLLPIYFAVGTERVGVRWHDGVPGRQLPTRRFHRFDFYDRFHSRCTPLVVATGIVFRLGDL